MAVASAAAETLRYDAQVAWISAGTLEISVSRDGDRYEMSGLVATSRAMDRFLRWQGRFAATGRFDGAFPVTDAYLLLEDDGETRQVLLAYRDKTTSHATDRDSEEVPSPPGSDLMSVTFLAPHCLSHGTPVHDGDDLYRIDLVRAEALVPVAGRAEDWREVAVRRCDYRFRKLGRRARRVSIWAGVVNGREVPVRIRVRVPLFPDGVLRLRLDP